MQKPLKWRSSEGYVIPLIDVRKQLDKEQDMIITQKNPCTCRTKRKQTMW